MYKYALIRVDADTINRNLAANRKLASMGETSRISWPYKSICVISYTYIETFTFDSPLSRAVVERDSYQYIQEIERSDKQSFWSYEEGDPESESILVSEGGDKDAFRVKILEPGADVDRVKLELVLPRGYTNCAILPGYDVRFLTVRDEDGKLLAEYAPEVKNEYGSYIRPFAVSTVN